MSKLLPSKPGSTLIVRNGQIVWFIDEFDDVWSNKYAIKCQAMAMKFYNFSDAKEPLEVSYNRIYRLTEFLWKLGVWKP